MTDTTTARDIKRLKRSVWILGAALLFFVASAAIHVAQAGSLRAIDIVILPVGALFAAYLRRLRAAQAKARH
ncbi:hypothetical protein ACVDG3_16190 [Meridianimarinicoccus sp. RP-17]|uniref:hypothetical protein n=1 Tax=Meridianimarinicoccus zhengii TaxID=2056810 RepID=UPI0013A68D0D|nr:hypothetical protein [Phycocomes zhengii]